MILQLHLQLNYLLISQELFPSQLRKLSKVLCRSRGILVNWNISAWMEEVVALLSHLLLG